MSEPILLSSRPLPSTVVNQFQTSICSIKIAETIEVVEAVSEYISSYRKSGKLIVMDGSNPYLPTNEEHHFTDFCTRKLRATEPEDMK